MFPMDPTAFPGIAFANPDAATALATGALVDVTNNLVIVGLVIGLGQIGTIVYGIWSMNKSSQRREAEHNKRLNATLDANQKHHDATISTLDAERAANERHHQAAMDALAAERAASERRHHENMRALNALIRRTEPGRHRPWHTPRRSLA